ncbi:alpha/beta hydrolase [Cohnella caldifontis]|uniref:alpha/beta hydrolase n=1 Tax=Cohnella caldifontis TaxID=3027471 RepID=UPI0023EAA634|nr:alpha/beta hydrolase [Cohnella sp. YIM B05605]
MNSLPAPIPLSGSVSLPPIPETRETPAARRAFRVLKTVALSTLLTLVLLYAGLHAFIAWKLTHPDVAPLVSNPMSAKHLSYEDVAFASSDGKIRLSGWWIPADGSRQTVVLSHGYGTNREESWVPMYDLADLLHGYGYNVLMFDYAFADALHRAPATGGVLESKQLLGAIEYARGRGSAEVVVWGFSMGAGTALQAALQHAPVDAMILDSTFVPTDDTLLYNLRMSHLELPAYPTLPLVKWFLPLLAGSGLEQVPAARALGTSFDFPIFVIHGTADAKAPLYLAEDVAKAQTDPRSELWVVKGAIHEMIFRTHRQEYVQRVTDFLGEVHATAIAKSFEAPALSI